MFNKIFFILLFSMSAMAEVKISQLPLNNGSTVGSTDSFPFVNVISDTTERLAMPTLFNGTITSIQNPTFTGTITAGGIALGNLNQINWKNFAGSGNLPLEVDASNNLNWNSGAVLISSGGNITAPTFISANPNPATAGAILLANTDKISWRNAANNANLLLQVDSSNNLNWSNGAFLVSSGGNVTFDGLLQVPDVVTGSSAPTNAIYRGGNSTLAATAAGGNLYVQAGVSTGASGGVGGDLYLAAGNSTNASDGTIHFSGLGVSQTGTDFGTINTQTGVWIIGAASTTHQHALNTATAASSNCGSLSGGAACVEITINGTTHYIPYF